MRDPKERLRDILEAIAALQSVTVSSGRQRVPAKLVSYYLPAAPPKQLAKCFGSFIQPLFARVSAAARESRILAALRDTLLPKLTPASCG